jgi:hypothetical protein
MEIPVLKMCFCAKIRFLPSFFGGEPKTGNLAAKVLTSYVHMEDITPPGRHAADQLLLRLKYLCFQGTVAELVSIFQNVQGAFS